MVIKTLSTQNPFSDYGTIVKGNRFVGRKKEIEAIRNRVLGQNFGNIAIMGLPRIGKTSLVWNALMSIKDNLSASGNFVSLIYVGKITSSNDFFKQLVYQTIEDIELIEDSEMLNKLKSIQQNIKLHENDKFEFTNLICKFYKILKRGQYRATYILDEFDSVKNIFSVADFQTLRQLSSQPETQICLITVSRRTIQEIEPENGAISNFYGIFSDLRLGVFSKKDINEYWNMVTSCGIEVTDEFMNSLQYLVGGHPFLMDLYNYEVFNILRKDPSITSKEISTKILSELKLNLFNNFENILNLLKDEGLYSKAIQLVLGPVYDVTTIDEQKLLKYEFIKLVDNNDKIKILKREIGVRRDNLNYSYICFSDYFTELLILKFDDIDYWPLWNQTEKAVREVIKDYITNNLGDNWEQAYLLKHEKSEGKQRGLQKLNSVRTDTKNKFGELASSHLVDYTFPRDMYDLFVSSDWTWFEKVFGESKSEWGKRFNTLAEIRNPIAHNNSEFVSKEDLANAKKYCEIIIDKISQWKAIN